MRELPGFILPGIVLASGIGAAVLCALLVRSRAVAESDEQADAATRRRVGTRLAQATGAACCAMSGLLAVVALVAHSRAVRAPVPLATPSEVTAWLRAELYDEHSRLLAEQRRSREERARAREEMEALAGRLSAAEARRDQAESRLRELQKRLRAELPARVAPFDARASREGSGHTRGESAPAAPAANTAPAPTSPTERAVRPAPSVAGVPASGAAAPGTNTAAAGADVRREIVGGSVSGPPADGAPPAPAPPGGGAVVAPTPPGAPAPAAPAPADPSATARLDDTQAMPRADHGRSATEGAPGDVSARGVSPETRDVTERIRDRLKAELGEFKDGVRREMGEMRDGFARIGRELSSLGARIQDRLEGEGPSR